MMQEDSLKMKMTHDQFHRELESILEAPQGSITSDTALATMGHWDSMAILSLISFADLNFGTPVEGAKAAKAATVRDLEQIFSAFLEG